VLAVLIRLEGWTPLTFSVLAGKGVEVSGLEFDPLFVADPHALQRLLAEPRLDGTFL
jgi:hypothetical protein